MAPLILYPSIKDYLSRIQVLSTKDYLSRFLIQLYLYLSPLLLFFVLHVLSTFTLFLNSRAQFIAEPLPCLGSQPASDTGLDDSLSPLP
jgi:hypothetical protein